MSGITGVGGNNYNLDLFITPPQNNSQSQAASGSSASGTPPLPTANTVQDSEQMDIINSVLSQSSTNSSSTLEALAAAMSNLQSISQANVMQTDPSLAQSLLEGSYSSNTLESLTASSNLLQAAEGTNLLQNNPSVIQSLVNDPDSLNSTGSLINTTA